MNSYVLDKNNYTGTIIYMVLDTIGYSLPIEEEKTNFNISTKNIIFFDKETADILVKERLDRRFKRLAEVILSMLYNDDDETDESDYFILLDEVERMRALIELRFQKLLKIHEYNEYLDKLTFLDAQLRQKVAIINYQNSMYYEETNHRSL